MQQIHPRQLEQVQASSHAEEHQFITHCIFQPSLCILSILTQIGKADSVDGIRTTTSSVPLSGAPIHTLRFSLDINFIQETEITKLEQVQASHSEHLFTPCSFH
jgi:hypothetical protein